MSQENRKVFTCVTLAPVCFIVGARHYHADISSPSKGPLCGNMVEGESHAPALPCPMA